MKETGKNVLSLFNGMGCIWIASEMAEVKINKRYSSEIEKFPNQANNALYPDTEQIGDVRLVDVSKLERIHLLAGGSPCQSFSFAGKRKGMAAKKEFIEPTEEDWRNFVEISNSDMHFDDYIEWQRLSHDRENKELIEILSLEHYLKLKEEEFEFEGQSYLFWEYIRILTEIRKYNPDVKFLLENVIMGKKWQKVITQAIGINPIRINAALVSAQNRDRLFWTNIFTEQDGFFGDLKCIISQPKDEGILLKDVLETFETSNYETQEEFDAYMKKYFLSDKMMSWFEKHSEKRGSVFKKLDGFQKSSTITCTEAKQNLSNDYVIHNTMPRSSKTGKGGTGHLSRTDGKTYCLDTGNTNAVEMVGAIKYGRTDEAKLIRKENMSKGIDYSLFQGKEITAIDYEKMGTLTTSPSKDNLVMQINPSKESGGVQPYQHNRIYDIEGQSPCLNTDARSPGILHNKTIRRLTPRECGRLQSVPEDKLETLLSSGISDTQLYKMFGNGWNCKVIEWILKHLN